jgi:Mce-associated membrane protein
VSSEDRPAGAVATSDPDTTDTVDEPAAERPAARRRLRPDPAGRSHERARRSSPRGARGPLALSLVLTVALVLVGAASAVGTERLRDDPVVANRALVDNTATTLVIGEVGDALTRVLSYSYTNTAATEQAAGDVLAGTAYRQYKALFPQVVQQAPAQELTVTTRVVRAGVIRLSGDTAQLLVFLDQLVSRRGQPTGTVAAAQLSITAQRREGHWRITDIQAR